MMFTRITDLSYLFIKSTTGKVCIHIRTVLFEVPAVKQRLAAGGKQPSGGL